MMITLLYLMQERVTVGRKLNGQWIRYGKGLRDKMWRQDWLGVLGISS